MTTGWRQETPMTDAMRPILVIGSLNMDLVARCRRLPVKGQTVFGQDFFTAAGGKGANQAVAAARLGARVAMAGCVGADAFGSALTAGLRDAGIDTDSVMPVARPTGTALITIDADGANTIVVISGANAACDTALVDRALASAAGPGILLLQNEIPADVTAHAILVAHASGWFIILNPAPAGSLAAELLPLVDIIAPNETEAAAITGLVVSGRAEAVAAARHLVARGARGVLITLGDDGALFCDASHCLHCPAVPVQAVDTTAAGDAYIGALGAALAEGRGLPESLGFAAAAAALSVTRLGAQPSLASRAELGEFVALHGIPTAEALPSKPVPDHGSPISRG
jgi:ribokinase